MVLENKDVYIDFGKTDYQFYNASIDIAPEAIIIADDFGLYNFNKGKEIRELTIREAEDDIE